MRNIILLLFLIFGASQIKAAENRIKIAVIDSGISYKQSKADYACKSGHKSFINESIYATHQHGVNIIGIISKSINPKTHCIVSYKFYNSENDAAIQNINATIKSLRHIVKDYSIRYVNMSMGGPEPSFDEKRYIKRLLTRGVTITVAAGNESNNLNIKCDYFPACYGETFKHSTFYVVKSEMNSSNYGKVVTDSFSGYRIGSPVMSGTSQASAQKMAQILNNVVYSNRRLDGSNTRR